MSSGYLDALDEILAAGLADLSPDFVARQIDFIASCQRPDGGFAGRAGPSDLYYTDFALRTLALLAPKHPALAASATYLAQDHALPDVVCCFNLLNAARLLAHCGHPIPLDRDAIVAALERHRLPTGAFARAGGQQASAYHTFLAALCHQMLPVGSASADGLFFLSGGGGNRSAKADPTQEIAALRNPDGGFADLAGEGAGQTSATAAAVGFLTMCDALGSSEHTAAFLAGMQRDDGGLAAHAAVPHGDLLSTFTGLITLSGLAALDKVDLKQTARFLRDLACPAGGFRSDLQDDQPDLEYTYYGLGVLAILRSSR